MPDVLPVIQHVATGPQLIVVLLLAGAGSIVVFGLALAALLRRRSRSYLLVAVALATLVARVGVAGLSLGGMLSTDLHHLLEHGLDALMAGLVIAAVYHARTVERNARPEKP
jgi:hypothetical protein